MAEVLFFYVCGRILKPPSNKTTLVFQGHEWHKKEINIPGLMSPNKSGTE